MSEIASSLLRGVVEKADGFSEGADRLVRLVKVKKAGSALGGEFDFVDVGDPLWFLTLGLVGGVGGCGEIEATSARVVIAETSVSSRRAVWPL